MALSRCAHLVRVCTENTVVVGGAEAEFLLSYVSIYSKTTRKGKAATKQFCPEVGFKRLAIPRGAPRIPSVLQTLFGWERRIISLPLRYLTNPQNCQEQICNNYK